MRFYSGAVWSREFWRERERENKIIDLFLQLGWRMKWENFLEIFLVYFGLVWGKVVIFLNSLGRRGEVAWVRI